MWEVGGDGGASGKSGGLGRMESKGGRGRSGGDSGMEVCIICLEGPTFCSCYIVYISILSIICSRNFNFWDIC